MSQGPENRLIAAIDRLLPKEIYREKMHNPYRGGTPDKWYSGPRGDLWIEWKWVPSMSRKGRLIPKLSPLQMKWLIGRYTEGRNVAVVVGCPEGCIGLRLPSQWINGVYVINWETKQYIAHWIEGYCL